MNLIVKRMVPLAGIGKAGLKFLLLFIGCFLAGLTCGLKPANPSDAPWEKIYRAYVGNLPVTWNQGIRELKNIYETSGNKDMTVLYRLAVAEYGMVGYCMATAGCTDLNQRMARVEQYAKTLSQAPEYAGSGKALTGGLLGMKIGLSPAKGIFLGPQSMSYLDEAVKKSPNDPTGWVELGNARFHAPSLVGGDKEKAIQHYEKAIALFDARPDLRKNNWLYLHALAWMGKAHQEQGRKSVAAQIYRKALSYEPGFVWVKSELLPAVLP